MSEVRVQPQAINAEKALLGSILAEESALYEVMDFFDSARVFHQEPHREIFKAFMHLFEENEDIDLVSVTNELNRRDVLERVGGGYYLSQLMEQGIPANVQTYARIVLEKAQARASITITDTASKRLYAGDKVDEVVDEAMSNWYKVLSKRESEISLIGDSIAEGMDRVAQVMHNEVVGIPMGYRALDKRLLGVERDDIIILAGRPSNGKTTLALNIAKNIAKGIQADPDDDGHALFVSMETDRTKLAYRLIMNEYGRAVQQNGEMDSDGLMRAGQIVESLPLIVRDGSGMSDQQFRAMVKSLTARYQIKVVIVDYLQKMSGSGRVENRTYEVKQIMQTLGSVPKDMKIPIIILSQLSRSAEGYLPENTHLRESGDIEQDADKIIGVVRAENLRQDYRQQHFPELADATPDVLGKTTILNISKVRDGETGVEMLYSDFECYRYYDYDHRYRGSEPF